MSTTDLLIARNRAIAKTFAHGDMPPLPKLGTMILTCADARVDPAHVLGLEPGEAVVFRNNGGRVTQAFIEEVSALAILVAKVTGVDDASFDIILMQHTRCGAERFADPEFSAMIRNRIGVDVSRIAITDHVTDLRGDIAKLRDAPHLPGGIRVSAMLYDVETGIAAEIEVPRSLAELRG